MGKPAGQPTSAKRNDAQTRGRGDAAKQEARNDTSTSAASPTKEGNGQQAPKARTAKPPAVDPALSRERFVLFVPGAPLVVELEITIDGRPFRLLREDLLDRFMKLAPRDKDGRPTWAELHAKPPKEFATLVRGSGESRDRKQFVKTYDTNRNRLVDRNEARRLVARGAGAGDAFELETVASQAISSRAHMFRLLDADENGQLATTELARAQERLKIRDANDDDIVTREELADIASNANEMPTRNPDASEPPVAAILGDDAEWNNIGLTLSELFGDQVDGDSFPLLPGLARTLDADSDEWLNEDEIKKFNTIPPHVRLAIHFGTTTKSPSNLSVPVLVAELDKGAKVDAIAPREASIAVPGLRLRFAVEDLAAAVDPADTIKTQLAALDGDKNGYLEKKEVPAAAQMFGAEFAELDQNSDGKLFADELVEVVQRRAQPEQSAIRVEAAHDADSLFPLFDADGDGRLIARELRHIAELLAGLDTNEDGELAAEEVPESIVVRITRGARQPSMPAPMPGPMLAAAPAAPSDGPSWFIHMDLNRDNEISPREFPGQSEKFAELDGNTDGFIDLAEAVAADAGTREGKDAEREGRGDTETR